MSREAVIVLARVPEPGRVKTRLIPSLGADGACRVHERLLEHTLATVAETERPAWLYLAGDQTRMRASAEQYGFRLRRQRGGDLGVRMAAALAEVHEQGFERVALVGSDCPVLDRPYLDQALAALGHAEFVLGPAEDGGYVLLGSACAAPWSEDPLNGVRFGGCCARADTLSRLRALGRVACLDPLWDVDEPGDWARARALTFPPAGGV
jgi:rSAM/selenodomain-associated transferase 1